VGGGLCAATLWLLDLAEGQPERLGQLARDGDPSRPGDLPARFFELGFRKQINHVAAHRRFPIKAIYAIEDHFVLLRLAINLR
jgi:hypothetical protein